MSASDPGSADTDHVRIIRNAFAAAQRGDFDALSKVLADDVRWHGAGGDASWGCTNRQEALAWIGEAVARGVRAKVLDVRELDENRVLVLLQRSAGGEGDLRGESPPPHGQIVTFRGDEVSEILVYPSDDAAVEAAAASDAAL